MLITIGLVLMAIGIIGIYTGFSANEWREPLIEIGFILAESKNPRLKKLNSELKTKGTVGMLFILFLYILGGIIVLVQYHKTWVMILIGIIFLLLLKGVMGLIKSKYSKNLRLLNYLYSPYLFAWRRDKLKEYTDQQITNAICIACGIDSKEILTSNMELNDFLLVLCQKTRPKYEYEQYPEVLEKSIAQANDLIWQK